MRFVHLPKLNEASNKGNGLDGAQLKLLAVLCMLLDHIGAVLVEPIRIGRYESTLLSLKQWTILYYVLRCIGRIAFPIFAFLIVEGFTHTRSKAKYLRNLCVFAVLSEVPFNLAISGQLFTNDYQNVFFTLAFGLIALMAMEFIVAKSKEKNFSDQMGTVLAIVAAVAVAGIAELLNTDYGAMGVLTICILYKYRQMKETGALLTWILLSAYNLLELFSLPFVVAVKYYNGQRGRQNKILFYVFYPLHLLVLVGISKLIYS